MINAKCRTLARLAVLSVCKMLRAIYPDTGQCFAVILAKRVQHALNTATSENDGYVIAVRELMCEVTADCGQRQIMSKRS